MCAVVLNEIPRLVIEYPMAFTKHSETGQYICVALFGVDPDRNLYWQDERWNSFTVPLNVGRQPFFVGLADNPAAGEGAKGLVTCIDLENPGVQTSDRRTAIRRERRRDSLSAAQARAAGGTDRWRAEVARIHRSAGGSRSASGRSARAQGAGPPSPARSAACIRSTRRNCVRSTRRHSRSCNGAGYLHAMYAMLSSLGHLQILARRGARCADIGRAPDRTRKEKAPATFVTGASLLGPWQ